MAANDAQILDLTNYSGRIFFISDVCGNYSFLCHLIHSVTDFDDDVVIIGAGNLFDNGPEGYQLLRAINTKRFEGRKVSFYSVTGFGEYNLKKLLPLDPEYRQFYPGTSELEKWSANGGSWHKDINRYHLEDQIRALMTEQLPLIYSVELQGGIRIGICSSDYAPIRDSFPDTLKALHGFKSSTVSSYIGQIMFGKEHALTPIHIKGVNFLVLGRNSVSSIRAAHGLPLNGMPVLLGNTIHIGPDRELSKVVRRRCPISMLEFINGSNPSFLVHQVCLNKSDVLSIQSNHLDIHSHDNFIGGTEP